MEKKEKVEKSESKIAVELQDRITKKVVILVLAFLFTAPLFTVSAWTSPPDSYDYGLRMLHALGPRTPVGLKLF
jgi:hypothetical protein